MTVALDRQPLYRWCPPSVSTVGDIASRVGADLGLSPDPEQRWLLDAIYAEKASSLPAARTVTVVAPRQNIKSSTFEIAALMDLFVLRVPLSIWTAHEFKTSRKAFEDMRQRILSNPDYLERCKFRDSHGEEAITLHTGETLEFHARSGRSGRGFTCDRLTLDEGLYLRQSDMGSLSPTLVTRPHAQIRIGSSAGLSNSAVLRGMRDRGRTGADPSLAYLEYGAPYRECDRGRSCLHEIGTPGCALDDRDLWWAANSAMWAGRITEEAIADQRRTLDPAEFMREFLSWWEDPTEDDTAIDETAWAQLADPGASRGKGAVFGVATAPDGSWTAIGVAWRRPDGHTQVMLADYRPTTAWVPQRLEELRQRWAGKVVVDKASRGLIAGAEEPSQDLQAQAHVRLADAVLAGTIRHSNEPALTRSVRASHWRPFGETRVLDRKGTADISPLVAVALAAHSFLAGRSTPPPAPVATKSASPTGGLSAVTF